MRKKLIIILLIFHFFAQAQIITLFAGNGKDLLSGDGGLAIIAGIPDPNSGTFDKYGNYFFPDLGAKTIRKIDTLGIITTIAGGGHGSGTGDGGPATSAIFNSPCKVIVDSIGDIYILDAAGSIRKINISTMLISSIAGNGTWGYAGDGLPASAAIFSDPTDMCFDKKGNLYISDANNRRVRKINTSGIINTFAGTGIMGFKGDNGLATMAQIDYPAGLVADDTGNIYIADPGSLASRIRKVDTFGIITTVAGNGMPTYIGDGIPAINAQINPSFLAIDSSNNLFIIDGYNERAYMIDIAGNIHNMVGNGVAGDIGDGGTATAAELYTPSGIAVDACGNLYVSETGTVSIPDSFNNIRKVTFDPTCDPYSHGTITDSGSLSVHAITTNNIAIYPNPATTLLTVTTSPGLCKGEGKIKGVTITNLIGQTIFIQAYDIEKAEVNISGLPEGMYIVKVTDSEGRVMVTKIVKE